jgi:hypothetical protein
MTMRGGDAVEQRRAARHPPLRFIYFRSPDAKPRGTGRNGQGRQVTAEAVDPAAFEPRRERIGLFKGRLHRHRRGELWRRRRPGTVHADKGYDYPRCRAELRRRGITTLVAVRNVH